MTSAQHQILVISKRNCFFTWVQERQLSHLTLSSLLQVRKHSSDGSFYACSSQAPLALNDPSAMSAYLGWHLPIPPSFCKIYLLKHKCIPVCFFFLQSNGISLLLLEKKAVSFHKSYSSLGPKIMQVVAED